jgi:hypothetical protein
MNIVIELLIQILEILKGILTKRDHLTQMNSEEELTLIMSKLMIQKV